MAFLDPDPPDLNRRANVVRGVSGTAEHLPTLKVLSLLVYPSRGESQASRAGQEFVRNEIKRAQPRAIRHSIQRLQDILLGPLKDFWADPGILVPVPGHAPRSPEDPYYVAEQICDELIRKDLAKKSVALLRRTRPVPRSTGQTSAKLRPAPKTHYESLQVETNAAFDVPKKITLVDDVVTLGSTLLGCASRLREAFPDAEIQAFALCRTDNKVDLSETSDMLAPRIGCAYRERETGRPVHVWMG